MKRLYTFFFAISLILALGVPSMETQAGEDEDEIREKLPFLQGQTNIGNDYWFAIPPCYEEESAGHDNFVKIMIAAPVRTKVTVEIPGLGYMKEKYTVPNNVIDFQIKPATAQPFTHNGRDFPAPPAQVYKGRGIHVYSESPIVVYVIVRYWHTSDGFLAIPTSTFGTHYINMVYEEPDITTGHMAPFTMITTPYDFTNISFTMGGGPLGNDKVPLANGRKLETGDMAQQMMHRGDVWALSIDDHAQDLSGSIIKGDKPFSIVSGVHCANFPLGVYACDYTVEMELPTHTWGKKYYVTPAHYRSKNGIIRIFAKEDNTTIYRNDTYFGTIKKGGGADFGVGYLENRIWPEYLNGEANPPKGAVFEADKPISIMYYNTGTTDDAEWRVTDPFMMIFTPIEQFQTASLFATPNAKGGQDQYHTNYMNIVYEVNEDGFLSKDLKYAKMPENGGEPEWNPLRDVFAGGQEIYPVKHNGKTYAWKHVEMPTEGVFGLKSDSTKFAAYSHGASDFDTYGFPTMAALNDLTTPDTLPPIPEYVQECNGDVEVDMGTVTDKPDDVTVRSNLADIYMIQEESFNYEFTWRAANDQFIPGQTVTASWSLTVEDKALPAKAVLYFTDRAGNDTTITVTYDPPEYEVYDDHDYELFKTNDPPKTHDFYIENKSESTDLYVTSITLKGNDQGFSIVGTGPGDWVPNDPSKPIPPQETRTVTIQFDPAAAPADDDDKEYFDSLGVGVGDLNKDGTLEECQFSYLVQVRAKIGAPVIEVTDHDFGERNIMINNWDSHVFTIRNLGDAELSITGISQDLTNTDVYRHDFLELHEDISETNPLILDPGQDTDFTVEFKPDAVQTYPDEIIFESDAGDNRDPVAVINGEGIVSEVITEGLEWTKHLINRAAFPEGPYEVDPALNNGRTDFYIENTGNDDNRIAEINFENISGEGIDAFKARTDGGDIMPLEDWFINVLQTQTLRPNDPERRVDVLFQPNSIGEHEVNVNITTSQVGVEETITARFFGIGGVPRITVTPQIDFGDMLVDNENDVRSDIMTITNEAHEFDYELTFEADPISFDDEGIVKEELGNWNGQTFGFDLQKIEDNTVLQPGQSIDVDAEFVAREVGPNNEVIATIHSNAEEPQQNESRWFGLGNELGVILGDTLVEICVTEARNDIFLTLENTSTQTLTINGLTIDRSNLPIGSQNDIMFADPQRWTQPFEMSPGAIERVNFVYNPTAEYGVTRVDVNIDHNYEPDQIIINNGYLELESYAYTSVSTSDIPGIAPEQHEGEDKHMVSIGESFDYEVTYIPEGDEFHLANANRFNVEVTFNDDFIKPFDVDSEQENAINLGYGNWTASNISVEETQDPELSKLVFTIEGDKITDEGVLFTIPFFTVLPSFNETGIDNHGVVEGGKSIAMNHTLTNDNPDGCFTHTSDGLIVGVREICMDNTRLLYISGESSALPPMVPNPVTSDGGTIKYSVSHDQPGHLVLYNSKMQKVATLVDGELKEGKHEVNIPIENLSSGAYFYELKTTTGREIQKMIINK